MAPQTWILAASISRLVKPRCARRSKLGAARSAASTPSCVAQEVGAERPFVEGEFDVESGRQRLFHFLDRLVGETFGLQRGVIDRRRLADRAVADRVSDHLGDLAFAIAKHPQSFRHGAVDDLEVAAAGELLEFHQREIGLDAGGVAIHDEADGAGRRHHGGLRIAIAVASRRARWRGPRRAWHARPTCGPGRLWRRAAPAASPSSHSRCGRRKRRGGDCASPAASPRGSRHSAGRRRARPPFRRRWRRTPRS